jgi:hypothetical protein
LIVRAVFRVGTTDRRLHFPVLDLQVFVIGLPKIGEATFRPGGTQLGRNLGTKNRAKRETDAIYIKNSIGVTPPRKDKNAWPSRRTGK